MKRSPSLIFVSALLTSSAVNATEWDAAEKRYGTLARASASGSCMFTALPIAAHSDQRHPGLFTVTLKEAQVAHCEFEPPETVISPHNPLGSNTRVLVVAARESDGKFYSPAFFRDFAELPSVMEDIANVKVEYLLASPVQEARLSGLSLVADLQIANCEVMVDGYLGLGPPGIAELVAFAEAVRNCPTSQSVALIRTALASAVSPSLAAVLLGVLLNIDRVAPGEYVGLLTSPNPNVRLASYSKLQDLPYSLTGWTDAALREPDPSVRKEALRAVRLTGQREALLGLAENGDDEAIRQVLILDGESPVEGSEARLLSAAGSGSPAVRAAAWESIRAAMEGGDRPLLEVSAFENAEEDPGIRYLQVVSAKHIGDPQRKTEFLLAAAKEPRTDFYPASLRAAFELALLCGPTATAQVAQVITTPSTNPDVVEFLTKLEAAIEQNGGRPCP